MNVGDRSRQRLLHEIVRPIDIARNTRIRQGLERNDMTETEMRQWLSEI